VVREAKKILGPKEAEELERLPEAERQKKTQKAPPKPSPPAKRPTGRR